MPSSEVFKEFKAGNLHSGKGGPIVKSRPQATAIFLSERRKEGYKVPRPKGGLRRSAARKMASGK